MITITIITKVTSSTKQRRQLLVQTSGLYSTCINPLLCFVFTAVIL